MKLHYEKPGASVWRFAPEDSYLLSGSNEDLPVVPVNPFGVKPRHWDLDDEWDD